MASTIFYKNPFTKYSPDVRTVNQKVFSLQSKPLSSSNFFKRAKWYPQSSNRIHINKTANLYSITSTSRTKQKFHLCGGTNDGGGVLYEIRTADQMVTIVNGRNHSRTQR